MHGATSSSGTGRLSSRLRGFLPEASAVSGTDSSAVCCILTPPSRPPAGSATSIATSVCCLELSSSRQRFDALLLDVQVASEEVPPRDARAQVDSPGTAESQRSFLEPPGCTPCTWWCATHLAPPRWYMPRGSIPGCTCLAPVPCPPPQPFIDDRRVAPSYNVTCIATTAAFATTDINIDLRGTKE
eukprot:9503851-Pyramimonas_sp.AAC.1